MDPVHADVRSAARPDPATWRGRLSDIAAGLVSLRWLLLANLFLISPVLLNDLDLPDGGRLDPVTLWVLLTSICWVATIELATRRPVRALLVLYPLAFVVTADLFLITQLDARLGTGYLAVVIESWSQGGEFVHTFQRPLLAVCLPSLLLFHLCLWKVRALTLTHRRRWALVPLTGLALLYGAALGRHLYHGLHLERSVVEVLTRDTNSPFGILPQGLVTLHELQANEAAFAQRRGFAFHATREVDAPGPEVHVLVIGETARPDHFGLNGYGRDTSPRLSRTPGLLSFRDVVSQASLTNRSVPLILTRATIDDFARTAREKSIVSAFKEVGFRTYWLASQEVIHWGGFIFQFAAESDVRRHFDRRYDDVLIAPFAEVVGSLGPQEKVFVVIHLQGSHFVYENRYPPEHERFPVAEGRTRRERLVNAYDNTIAFTDHVLGGLIEQLAARPDVVSSLLFVSDHGENLLDDERAIIGHGQSTEFDLRVPLLFWHSPAFARLRPEAIRNAQARLAARLSTANVFDSLADLGGLRGAAFDRRRSVFSASFEERPRRFARHDEPIKDFDEEVARRAQLATGPR